MLVLYTTHARNFFFTGAKIHKTAGMTRVIEKSGKSFTLKGESEVGLKKEIQVYLDHADEVNWFI